MLFAVYKGLQVPFVPTGHASTKKNDDTERLGPIRVADHGKLFLKSLLGLYQ